MKYPIEVQLTNTSKLHDVDFNNIPFGKVFSDHMFIADYYNGNWRDLRIVPFAPLPMSPSSMVLHYAQTIFEGMKVMKSPQDEPLLFRPELHAQRLNASARRMAMPEIPQEMFMQALHELISIDNRWIPDGDDSALYIRPFMIADDPFIGIRPSETYKFIIFTAPVGAYYSKSLSLLASDEYSRASIGGTGFAKTGGNYAKTLQPVIEAQKEGFDQIMWLDPSDFKTIQECGTMNLFFQIDDTFITPNLNNTTLEGITRKSFIDLLRWRGHQVEERPITIDEVVTAAEQGRLNNLFGSGTAAVVAPVKSFGYKGKMYHAAPVEGRKITQQLKADLQNLRSGRMEDPFGWTQPVKIQRSEPVL